MARRASERDSFSRRPRGTRPEWGDCDAGQIFGPGYRSACSVLPATKFTLERSFAALVDVVSGAEHESVDDLCERLLAAARG